MVEAQNSNYTFTPKPITNLYLGPEYSDNDIEKKLKNVNGISFKHCDKINDEMSELAGKRQYSCPYEWSDGVWRQSSRKSFNFSKSKTFRHSKQTK